MNYSDLLSRKIFFLALCCIVFSGTVFSGSAHAAQKFKPVISITSPGSQDLLTSDAAITFSATATDALDGDISNNVSWSSNIDGYIGTGSNVVSVLSVGSHTISALVTNSQKTRAKTRISLSVSQNTQIPVNTSPGLSIDTPDTNATFDTETPVTLTASAMDAEDGDLSYAIEWNSDIDGYMGTGSSVTTQLSAGNHQITATVADSENEQVFQAITVNIAEIINNAPLVVINTPGNADSFNYDSVITFSASATDFEDGDISYNIQWQSSIDGILGDGAEISTSLSTGSHTITATITDSSDLSHTQQITLSVEEQIADTGVEGSATVSWTTPTENTDGTSLTDLAGFKVYYGTSVDALDQVVVIDNASQTIQEVTNLNANINYYFAVTAVNQLGVESDFSSIHSKLIN